MCEFVVFLNYLLEVDVRLTLTILKIGKPEERDGLLDGQTTNERLTFGWVENPWKNVK